MTPGTGIASASSRADANQRSACPRFSGSVANLHSPLRACIRFLQPTSSGDIQSAWWWRIPACVNYVRTSSTVVPYCLCGHGAIRRSIEPDSCAARWQRECETSVYQIFARDVPCFTSFSVFEEVHCIWADPFRMDNDCLLRRCRETDSLDKPAACLRAVKLPADPFLRTVVERRMWVVVAIEHQVSCSAPDVNHSPGTDIIVIVPADVKRHKQHGSHAAVVRVAVCPVVESLFPGKI